MRLHKNNDSITLVELIISMAITAIVLSMIALIISTAAKSFKSTNEDVNLQMEAQVTINQLSTILMEASEITTGSAILPDKKYLIKGSVDSTCYAVYLKTDTNRLYLIPADGINGEDIADSIDPTETTETEYLYLMAEYVTDINIETNKKSPRIVIDFKLGDSTYTASKKVTLRNAK